MSRATEIAEAEAEEAEAENPEPDTEPEPEPIEPEEEEEIEQPAPEVLTEKQIEAAFAKLDKERDRHGQAVKKALGPIFEGYEVCPLCQAHGFYPPEVPPEVASVRLAVVTQALGAAAPQEFKPHPSEQPCERCGALGKLATGSLVPGQETLPCTQCNGMGHHPSNVATFTPNPQTGANVPTELPITTVPLVEQYRIGHDAWGRPPGDLHYGVPLPSQAPASA